MIIENVLVLKKGGKRYQANNLNAFLLLCYRIDGKLFDHNCKLCDYGMGIVERNCFYLIELKGCDLKTAAEQIYSTFLLLHPILQDVVFHGRVIVSRIQRPDLRSSTVIKIERMMIKQKGTFIKKCIELIEDIE